MIKFLFSFMVIALFGLNGYAQESTSSEKNLNIMEFVLFLNANQANNGASSFKADPGKKTLHYFDSDGRLIEESYIDENNDIISKKYNKEGKIVSETRITEESIRDSANDADAYHKQVAIPEAIAALQKLSEAAESYAKANHGNYPKQMTTLTEVNPPYIDMNYCNTALNPSYFIKCDLGIAGYVFTAVSYWPQYKSDTYLMKTGGILEQQDISKRTP